MTPSLCIGVEYKFSDITLGVLNPEETAGVEFIRLQWVDYTNAIRYRIMSLAYFRKLLASQRPGPTIPKVALGMVNLSIADGFNGVGEYIYALDLNSLRLCPYESGHASLMGWFEEKVPVQLSDGSSSVSVALCPRTTLKRVVDRAERESQVKFLIGFESEFILLKNTDPIEYASIHPFACPSAMRPGDVVTKVMNEIAKSIQASGIELQVYHAEAAPGQYEVVTGPLPPLESADALIHTREIIYNTAALHGLRATFAPRLSMTSTGSAAHAHISVHSTRPGSRNTSTMSSLEESFLAGVLAHLPALPALTLPTTASYKRVQDGIWSGGTYVSWGTENRECPIRLTNPHSPTSRRFEMRFIDGTANPYLALAGILGAGHSGIREEMKCAVRDCVGPKSPAEMTQGEREELGIMRRMPLSWEEGRKNVLEDPEMVDVLGEELLEKYLSVNKLLDETIRGEKEKTIYGLKEVETPLSPERLAARDLDRLVHFY